VKIISTKDFKARGIKCLIHGGSGIGKTTLCATCPAPIIISAESGLLSLSSYDLPVVEMKTLKDLEEVYDWLETSKEANKYRTICIDSISDVAEVILMEYKKRTKDGRMAYGEMADDMGIIIRKFRDLPGKNVYMIAKTKRVVDEASSLTSYMPSVPGQLLLQDLPFLFDLVGAMRYGKTSAGVTYRYIQTEGDMQWSAKDRSGALAKVEEPHLGKLFKKIAASFELEDSKESKPKTKTKTKTSTKQE